MHEERVDVGTTFDASIQGERGSNSWKVAVELLNNPSPKLLECKRSEDAFEAVSSGQVDQAVIAVENTIAGSVNVNLDLLYQHKLYINAQTDMMIRHALVAAVGVQLEDVRFVYSHPVALEQCQRFLRQHRTMEQKAHFDTAGAVVDVIREGRRDAAGIAGPWTAEMFGGCILADDIGDRQNNYTRFYLVSRDPHFPVNTESRVCVVFSLIDKPGALVDALIPFKERNINVYLHQRPIPDEPFKSRYYLDAVQGPDQGEAMDEAISVLERVSSAMRVLGKFPVRMVGV